MSKELFGELVEEIIKPNINQDILLILDSQSEHRDDNMIQKKYLTQIGVKSW